MNPTHHELLPTLRLRAAKGDRANEAAIILTRAELLDQLTNGIIIIDPDHNLAWIDWPTRHHKALHHAINHLTH